MNSVYICVDRDICEAPFDQLEMAEGDLFRAIATNSRTSAVRTPLDNRTGVTLVNGKRLICAHWKGVKRVNAFATYHACANRAHVTSNMTIREFASCSSAEIKLQCFGGVRVKTCPSSMCKKVNGFTLKSCSNCGASLEHAAEEDPAPNTFVGFVYGVGLNERREPLWISIRCETPDVLVCDDMHPASPCHLLAIPMSRYIQDWRFLLLFPRVGLQILEDLELSAWKCVCVN